ncbi:hypothetical protein BUALT_Bualt14G0043500 [Buddleja alternifolia]|uniref:NADP-dependent oxidoreductase domain-containing protein n=1 Tax=Buddleja alternifolia TaxID=168488 RepID=A0AAV6WHQ5_9LAMI|nr:hypothetical protein BUALT_Bualt14G0043500 [Buddleja alternifolia]
MSGRTANYRDDEDVILCQAYMEVSQDSITGISQTSKRFWARVSAIFNNSKNSSYADRGQRSLQCRYSDIEAGVKRLLHSIKHLESQNPSGASEQTIVRIHPKYNTKSPPTNCSMKIPDQTMQYKNLGRSGLKVSQLSYGAWVTFGNQLDVKDAKSILQCCRDNGVNFFDNAEVYANGRAEEIMGQAIKELGWKRSDIVVSTKIFWGGPGPNDKGLSRKHILEGTKNSLKRLDMEYVDLLYCHRPDTGTPIEETVRAMNYVIDKGWAYYWGTSEWSAQQITEAWGVAQRLDLVGPIVEQPEYNLFSRHKVESEYLPLYTNYGIGLTTWSPLASGVLTGKYNSGNVPPDSRFALENYKFLLPLMHLYMLVDRVSVGLGITNTGIGLFETGIVVWYHKNLASRSLVDDVLKKVNGLKPIADELGVPLSQLAIAWCASNPNVSSVITGATKEAQIQENMKAINVIPLLTPAVLEKIEAVVQSKPKRPDSYR